MKPNKVIFPYVNKFGNWDVNIAKFLISELEGASGRQDLLDIGANQGLISMQIANGLTLHSLKFTSLICIEPVSAYFKNLCKNISHNFDNVNFSAFQIGLGLDTKDSQSIYFSNRNATATLSKRLSFDRENRLKEEKVMIQSVASFVEVNLLPLNLKKLVVKSDTDGLDVMIFSCLSRSPILDIISTYVLEVYLGEEEPELRETLIRGMQWFSEWRLIERDRTVICNKELILEQVRAHNGLLGDLLLSR